MRYAGGSLVLVSLSLLFLLLPMLVLDSIF